MSVKVILTPAELLIGAFVGSMRNVEDIKKNIKPAYGAGLLNSWQKDILGALGEMTLAKHKNLYWSKGKMFEDDVGPFQVRTANPGSRLILHKKDEDGKTFYFVTGRKNEFVIEGSILAEDGKQECFWCDPQGTNRWAYFVPINELRRYDTKDD